MNHETMLAFLMGQRRGGGSSGGSSVKTGVLALGSDVTLDAASVQQNFDFSVTVDGATIKKACGIIVGTPVSFAVYIGSNSRHMYLANVNGYMGGRTLAAGEYEVYITYDYSV